MDEFAGVVDLGLVIRLLFLIVWFNIIPCVHNNLIQLWFSLIFDPNINPTREF